VRDVFNDSTDPSSVIYPGSDFKHFSNTDISKLPDRSIGMVYRLDRDKLDETAIEIFIGVAKKDSLISCYIIGDGYYLKNYKDRVKQEGLEKQIIFTGMIEYAKLPDYYKKISTFVAPVHDESFGQVVPFAMGMGLAVAGYTTGALPEILGSRETLVQHGNIEALANIILDLINNGQKREEIGRKNQLRANQQFSVEQMIDRYRMLYKSVIEQS
jgi:glycosyltransferase involved in cell wall biosynthesis